MIEWAARAIFCDDIRQEHNGKVILIGIYQGALATPSFPLSVLIATYVDVRGLDEGTHRTKIVAEYVANGEVVQLATLESDVEVTDGDLPTILQGSGMNLSVEQPGVLNIWLSVDGDRPRIIDTLKVFTPTIK